MTIYAACMRNTFQVDATASVRRYVGGSAWADVTANLNTLVYDHIAATGGDTVGGWLLSDLQQIKGRVFGVVASERTGWDSAIVELVNGQWRIIATAPGFRITLSGFFVDGNVVYVHGTRQYFYFRIYTFDLGAGTLTLLAEDADNIMQLGQAWPHGVLVSPTNKDHLILGDAYEDDWGWYEISTNTFHLGSDPGGSCIFAMTVDADGAVWSGDYGKLYYVSTDGGHTFSSAEIDFGVLPEIWCFTTWEKQVIGVGCDPASVIRRTTSAPTAPLDQCWDQVARLPDGVDPDRDGDGFQCTADAGTALLIGCGGEPYYYLIQSDNATVYSWAGGSTLVDVGGGLDWGWGVHLLNGERPATSYLRMTQRNDGDGIAHHPRLDAMRGSTSTQTRKAPRVGGKNTYT